MREVGAWSPCILSHRMPVIACRLKTERPTVLTAASHSHMDQSTDMNGAIWKSEAPFMYPLGTSGKSWTPKDP